MATETITAILDPAFKTGVSQKNGKQWTMAQINTDQNHVATVFMPAAVGDKVEMTWNDKYGNWSAQKVNAQTSANMEALRKLYALNMAIYEAVTGSPYKEATDTVAAPPAPAQKPTGPVEPVVVPLPEPDWSNIDTSKPIDLKDIPFN